MFSTLHSRGVAACLLKQPVSEDLTNQSPEHLYAFCCLHRRVNMCCYTSAVAMGAASCMISLSSELLHSLVVSHCLALYISGVLLPRTDGNVIGHAPYGWFCCVKTRCINRPCSDAQADRKTPQERQLLARLCSKCIMSCIDFS